MRDSERGRALPLIGAAVLFVLFAAGGCSLKSPSAPSWDIALNLPLFDRWFDLADLLEDTDLVPVGLDSVYAITVEDSLERVEVGTDITLDGFSDSVSSTVGTFTVPAGVTKQTSLPLSDIYPAADSTGTPLPIFPASFDSISRDIANLDNFTQVTIAAGTLTFSITNNAKVDFDQLVVEIRDDVPDGDPLLLTADMTETDTLRFGESRSVALSLAGITMSNDLILVVSGSIVGGGTVTFDGTERLDISISMGDLTVSSVTGDVDPIDFTYNQSIALTDSSRIDYAILGSGTLGLSLQNTLSIPLDLTITMPGVTIGGVPLQVPLSAAASATANASRNLSGYTIMPDPVTRELAFDVRVTSPGDTSVTLASTDAVTVTADISNLVIDEVSGELTPTTLTLPAGGFDISSDNGNLLDEMRKLQLASVELRLTLKSTIGFPVTGSVTLTGEGGSPDNVLLPLTFNAEPGTPGSPPVVTVNVLSSADDTALLDFLNAVPTRVTYAGSVTVGEVGVSGVVSSTSYVDVGVEFETPLEFTLAQAVVFDADVSANEDSLEQDDSFGFQEATLTYSLASTMGLPMTARFMAATDSARVYSSPDVVLELAVRGATTGVDTTLTITKAQWDILSKPGWFGLRLTLPPTPTGTSFRVSKQDRVNARAFLRIGARIQPGEGGGS